MKIITQNNSFHVKENAGNQVNKSQHLNEFDKILKNSIKSGESEHGDVTSLQETPTPESHGLSQASLVQFHPPRLNNNEQLVEKIEGFLDVLENYASGLIDSTVDMHDIHPLMCTIKKENEFLEAQLSQLDEKDNLKKVLDEILQTTTAEIKRFENGDYVNFDTIAD